MSGTQRYVYMFNSPQFFYGLFGHCGVVIEQPNSSLRVYSFHPKPNQGEMFDEGSVAQLEDPSDGVDFETFAKACMCPHDDDGRKDNRGIRLTNGYTSWYERMRRFLRLAVNDDQAIAMESFAQHAASDPHRFNVISYSCQHFVNDVFAAGGVRLYGKRRPITIDPIPNSVYRCATAKTHGITSFAKIDLESEDFPNTPSSAREAPPSTPIKGMEAYR